jgi:ABC-2 type transport system ATP-binding protein
MKVEPIVEIRDLKKNFDEVHALDGVNLDILPGRIIGLLGANGSGKTTLLRHMIGLYLPTSGSCRTLGVEAADLRSRDLKRIGFVHQENELLDYLTVRQLIDYVAGHYDGWNAELEREYVERFELPCGRKVGGLSPGLRQRVAILLAIGFEPELLILDEPASF